MSIAVIVATYGDRAWYDLGRERAVPSVVSQAAELVIVHDDKLTLAEARNAGASRAKSETLVFLDADDELAPGYLDAIADAKATLGARRLVGDPLRGGPYLLVPRVQQIVKGAEGEPRFPNRHARMDELNHCVIGTAVPRDLFWAVGGFRRDLPIYEDWALFLACKRAGATLVDVPGAVYRAFAREGGRNEPGPGSGEIYQQIRNEHLTLSRKAP